MIILDTNVVSEPLKPRPDAAVLAWLNAQAPRSLFITSISLAELFAGIDNLPDGQRRRALAQSLSAQLLALFADRVLGFDASAATAFANIHAQAKRAGNPMGFADCSIAAIAQAHDFALATRNLRDFQGTDIRLINPWDHKAQA
jgi:predicted nucleic acid-binding protein